MSADLDVLAAYVGSLTCFDPSPLRNADGSLTVAAQAGRVVFTRSCAGCHGTDAFTDSATGRMHDIGTIKPASGTRLGAALTGLDTPTLRDAWATAPYLHDGSAATIEDAVRAHTSISLASGELDQVAAFVRAIGAQEPAVTAGTGTGTGLRAAYYPNLTLAGTPALSRVEVIDADWGTGRRAQACLRRIPPARPVRRPRCAGDRDLPLRDVVRRRRAGLGRQYPGDRQLDRSRADGEHQCRDSADRRAAGRAAGRVLRARRRRNDAPALAGARRDVDGSGACGSPASGGRRGRDRAARRLFRQCHALGDSRAHALPGRGLQLGHREFPGTGVPSDNFSARWTGFLTAPAAGTYRFRTVSDDGVRLWVNGTRVINNWTDHGPTTDTSAAITLSAGQRVPIGLDYYERGGGAVVRLQWLRPGTSQYAPVPASVLTPQ